MIGRICGMYEVMLRAYPKAFRIQFGREMRQVFRDSCRAAVMKKELLRFIPRALWDWLRTSLRERLATIGSPEIHLKGWWLLVLCGLLDAIYAAMSVLMASPRTHLGADMSLLALAAGACAVAAGLWNSGRSGSWLLATHGLALGAVGVIGISPLVRRPLGFGEVAPFFALIGFSAGVVALGMAQGTNCAPIRYLLTASGAASLVYACSFAAVGFGWIKLGPPPAYWIWMSSYFAFTALCMFSIATRLYEGASSRRLAI